MYIFLLVIFLDSVSLFLAGTNPEEKTGNWNPQKRPRRRSLKSKWKQASAHVRTPEKSEKAKKKKRREKKIKKLTKPSKWREIFADIMWSRGILGMEGRPFCPPFLVGKTPASMTLSEFQRADSNSVNQRRGSRETTWSNIKGTREAHQN